MNCEQIRRLLAPFVGGQLDAGKHRAVELHVERCAVCAKELADLRATVEALHSLDPMPVPPGFVERVRDRVDARAGARFRLWAWVAPIGAVAVLALGLGVLGPLVRTRDTAPVIMVDRSRDAERERSETAPKEEPKQGASERTERERKDTPPDKADASPPAPRDQAVVSQETAGPRDGSGRQTDDRDDETVAGYAADGSAVGVGKPGGSRSVEGTGHFQQWKAAPPDQEGTTLATPEPPKPSGTRDKYHLAESPKSASPGGGRPSLGNLRTDPTEATYGAAGFSAATAGERANWWAKSEPAQSQLVLLARNELVAARAQAPKAVKDSPIIVAALTGQPTPDRNATLYLNVQSMRSVADAEVTLGNVAQLAGMTAPAAVFQDDAASRVLWRGRLAEADVKTIPLDGAARVPIAQRADLQVAASEPKPAGKAVAGKMPASEVVNFALFVPPDVGRAQSLTKASFVYVQQPLDVVFGDLAARSGLALLVREPYGRVVDLRTPAITAQQAIRLLAEQQGYHVIPDAVAWTLY